MPELANRDEAETEDDAAQTVMAARRRATALARRILRLAGDQLEPAWLEKAELASQQLTNMLRVVHQRTAYKRDGPTP